MDYKALRDFSYVTRREGEQRWFAEVLAGEILTKLPQEVVESALPKGWIEKARKGSKDGPI